jgi:hypothetical protein
MTDTDKPSAVDQLGGTQPKAAPRRTSRAFRRQLLAELPRLSTAQWQAKDTLDVYKDLQGLVGLDAEAFLRPLEPMVRRRNE